jgi:hypothetical protein
MNITCVWTYTCTCTYMRACVCSKQESAHHRLRVHVCMRIEYEQPLIND